MGYRNRNNNEPRVITAKYDSFCAETKAQIKKGESCVYYPSSKEIFHHDSKQAQTYREMIADDQMTGCQY